jgi:hypothetical protein
MSKARLMTLIPVFVPEGRCEFSPGLQSWDGVVEERLSAGGTAESLHYRPICLLLMLVFTQSLLPVGFKRRAVDRGW